MNLLRPAPHSPLTRIVWQLGLALGLLAGAVPPDAGASDLRFENLLDRQSDIPGNSVLAMVQDKQGFIWMGTQGGLYRHDGLRSTVFRNDPADALSLPGDYVGALFRDSEDRLWLGTNNGLARYNPDTASFTRFRPPPVPGEAPNNEYIRSIRDDGKGGLWLGTARNLQHFDPASGRFEVFQHEVDRSDSLGSKQVYALARDASQGLWIAAWPAGIDYLAPGSKHFIHYRLDESAAPDQKENRVHALEFDRAGQLWIGTAKGVQVWRPGTPWNTRKRLPGPAGNEEFSVYSIYQDHQGSIWVGTQPAGLLRWDARAGRFNSYRHFAEDPYSLPSNRVPAVLLDRSDTLWVGSWDNGVSRVDLASRGLEQFIPDAGDGTAGKQGKVIGSMSPAGPNRIWMAGPGGLRLFDVARGQIVQAWRHDAKVPGSLPNDYILTVLQQGDGPLWLGTTAGLDRLDRTDGKFRSYHFPDPGTNFIRKIIPSRKTPGALWLATDGALLHFSPDAPGAVRAYRHDSGDPDSRSSDTAGALLEDRRGRLWVGSPYGYGLDVRDPASGKFAHYRRAAGDDASLSNDFANCLFEDSHGRVWIGTANGLNMAREGADGKLSFSRHLIQAGQSANAIFSIEEDHDGRLWLAATGGVLRYDPANGKVDRFSASDGLTSGNFISSASFRDASGDIYFGSFRGVSIISPAKVHSNTIPAEVSVTDLRVRNRSLNVLPREPHIRLDGAVTSPGHLTLAWSDAMFAIEFAAMHYSDPQKNQYAYRLEGFDRDWIYADATHRVATYTNLDPGEYRFHLLASNKNGVWGKTPLTLPITILPPLWQTWWFRLLAAAGTAGALMLAYRWRVTQLRRRQRQLENLVRERTDELACKNDALTEANRALEQMSLTDPLTGLQNRRFLEQKMPDDVQLALRRFDSLMAKPAPESAIVFYLIDLDHFKMVNDRYGHAGGDQILLQIRSRLEQVFRATDYLVRWGGEEFLIVARDSNPAHASEVAARVQSAIAGSPFRLEDGEHVRQNCSVGFACFPFSATQPKLLSWQEVLKLADLAMYAGKRSGRAAWVGLSCGAEPLSAAQVRHMLAAPGAALQAGSLKAEASVSQQALLAAWNTLPDNGATVAAADSALPA